MPMIAKNNNVVTLINVFTVRPEQQQRLVDVLVEATEAVMKYQPCYVSANIHKSLDGTRVTNYAQWRSREAFEATREGSLDQLPLGGPTSPPTMTYPRRLLPS